MKGKVGNNAKSLSGGSNKKASGNFLDLGLMKTEEQLLRLSCAVESLRDAVYITDFDHNIIYANPAIEFAQGYKPEEVIGQKASEFFEGVPGNPPDLAGLIQKEARDGFWLGEIFNRRKDGTVFPVQLIENTIYGKKGEVLGYIGISRNISERKQSEKTNRRLAEIARNATDGIILTDPRGRISYVNPAYVTMSGYSESELLGRDPAEFIVADDPIGLGDEIREAVRKEGRWTGELLCRRKRGEIYPVESRVFAIRNPAGEVIEIAAIQQDISGRKWIENELRESEERFRELVEKANDIIYSHDLEGNFTSANPAAARVFGYTVDEILKLNITRIVDPDYLALARKKIREKLEGSPPTGPYELLTRDKNNKPIWVEVNTRLVEKAGRPIGVHGIARDITQRKMAEEAYRVLVENSLQGLIILKDKKVIFANQVIAEMLGYTVEELMETSPEELEKAVHPQDRDLVWGRYRERLEGKPVPPRYEIRVLRKDGQVRWAEMFSSIIDYRGEKATQAAFVDITERKKMEEELLKAQKLESVGILAGGIAHDFNNILTVILGNISITKSEAEPESRMFNYLSKAESACGRAKNLTQQLLTFAKGGAPVKKIVSLAGLLKESVSFALHGTNINCEFSLAKDLSPVEVDEGQISQALNNLIINAEQAMPEGGTIKLEAENINLRDGEIPPLGRGKYVRIALRDRGIGIPARHLGKIFDPFFSTKEKGSGLGLSTVYSIVTNHSGTVMVESQIGEGTTFFIYLPASERAPEEKEKTEKKIASGAGRILVMDDEIAVREVIAEHLEKIGYQTECAADGTEAVTIYRKAAQTGRPFNAVILDLTVPGGGGGRETLQELKKIDPGVKAIVASGYSTDPVISDYKEYGFRGIITKPFKMNELSDVLRNVIMDEGNEAGRLFRKIRETDNKVRE